MADDIAVNALIDSTRGAVSSSAWKQYHKDYPEADLSKADLSNLELIEFDLRNCNLAAAKLFNSDLAGADLSKANLTYADLRRCNLANAFLTKVNASGIDLTGANLVDTNLDGADLRGARLGGAHLVGASLVGADLRASDMRGANLKFTNLAGAHLEDANVEDATIVNVDIDPKVIKKMRNADRAIFSGSNKSAATSGKGLKPFESYDDLFLEEDCYKILGVDAKANLDEITKAYRKRAKEYHPDRVHNLGEKIRYVAGKEFERIQHAYTSLSQQKAKPAEEIADNSILNSLPKKDPSQFSLNDYVKLAKVYPNNDVVFYNLGLFYFKERDYENAVKAYTRCLKINSQNQSAQYNLRVAMMMLGLVQK
jgi:uncharacterized protein YjbI with pentapeptide repeats